jgi:hypothetical protein
MPFVIKSLPYGRFEPFFAMSPQELRTHRALITTADHMPGFPCRVSLQDATVGERVLLMNFEHLPAQSPFRASHAIYVREHAVQKLCAPNETPPLLHSRLLSLRAFDAQTILVDADVIAGTELEPKLQKMFDNLDVEHIDIHLAKPGCFAARAVRG